MDANARRAPGWSIAVAIALAGSALLLSATLIAGYLGNGQDLALIRNALVYDTPRDDALFSAPPDADTPPDDDPAWHAAAATAGALDTNSTELQRAIALIKHLDRPGPPLGGMIALPSLDTYRIMQDSGRGYCADYTEVFMALARAAGLSAREWGISFTGYSGAGHALIEIYDHGLGAWVMLDVFNGFYVSDEHQRPLSLPALRERILRGTQAGLRVEQVNDVIPFASPQLALHYLGRGMARAYLWQDTAAGKHDTLDALSRHSRALAQMLAIVSGRAPRMLLMPAPSQRPALLELRLVRLACVTAPLSVLVLLLAWWNVRRRGRADIAP